MLRKLFRKDSRRTIKRMLIILIVFFFLSFLSLPFDSDLFLQLLTILTGLIGTLATLLSLLPGEESSSFSDLLRARNDLLKRTRDYRLDRYFPNVRNGNLELKIKVQIIPQFISQTDRFVGALEKTTQINGERSIYSICKDNGFRLMILGSPGSGKTFMLRQVLASLVNMAEHDVLQPIPIFLNLSSWSRRQVNLHEWITQEVYHQLGIRKEITGQWLGEPIVVLLLDALDEVPSNDRQTCVDSINQFIEKNPHIRMVVSCRTDEFEGLLRPLNVPKIISLLPLDKEQVENYLRHTDSLTVIHLMHTNKELYELAKTPLLLGVMTQAYRETPASELENLRTISEKLKHLFDTYISRMFEHRPLPSDSGFDVKQACKWLTNIAIKMKNDGRSELYLENISEAWLSEASLRWYSLCISSASILLILPIGAYAISTSLRLIFNLIVGASNSDKAIFIASTAGVAFFLVGMIQMLWHDNERRVILKEKIKLRYPSNTEVTKYLGSRALAGVLLGALIGWVVISLNMFSEIEKILVTSLSGSRIYALVENALYSPIELAKFVSSLVMPGIGLVVGSIVGLHHLFNAITESADIKERSTPNIGISLSLRNSFFMAAIYAISVTPVLILLISVFLFLFGEKDLPIKDSFIFLGTLILVNGGVIAVTGWWLNGGKVVVQHYLIRYLLEKSDCLPYSFSTQKLVSFLDLMSERVLLRQIGGGWEFYHRLLHDHFGESKVQ